MLYPNFLRKMRHRSKYCLVAIAVLIGIGLFFFVNIVFAQSTYIRTPSGSVIQNPITFEVTPDPALKSACISGGALYWTIYFSSFPDYNDMAFTDPVDINLDSFTSKIILNPYSYASITLICGNSFFIDHGMFGGDMVGAVPLDDDNQNPLFTTKGSIFFPDNFVANILAYAGRFFTDLNPMLLMWLGLAVGFWIIQYVIDLIVTRSRKNK